MEKDAEFNLKLVYDKIMECMRDRTQFKGWYNNKDYIDKRVFHIDEIFFDEDNECIIIERHDHAFMVHRYMKATHITWFMKKDDDWVDKLYIQAGSSCFQTTDEAAHTICDMLASNFSPRRKSIWYKDFHPTNKDKRYKWTDIIDEGL